MQSYHRDQHQIHPCHMLTDGFNNHSS